MPSDSLREANLKKGRKFKRLVRYSLLGSWAIFIIAIAIIFINKSGGESIIDYFESKGASASIYPFFAMAIIPIYLSFFRLLKVSVGCSNCAAFGNIIGCNSKLIAETYLGRKVVSDSSNGKVPGTYDRYSRTYDNNFTCNCCEYQWTNRTTNTEEERV